MSGITKLPPEILLVICEILRQECGRSIPSLRLTCRRLERVASCFSFDQLYIGQSATARELMYLVSRDDSFCRGIYAIEYCCGNSQLIRRPKSENKIEVRDSAKRRVTHMRSLEEAEYTEEYHRRGLEFEADMRCLQECLPRFTGLQHISLWETHAVDPGARFSSQSLYMKGSTTEVLDLVGKSLWAQKKFVKVLDCWLYELLKDLTSSLFTPASDLSTRLPEECVDGARQALHDVASLNLDGIYCPASVIGPGIDPVKVVNKSLTSMLEKTPNLKDLEIGDLNGSWCDLIEAEQCKLEHVSFWSKSWAWQKLDTIKIGMLRLDSEFLQEFFMSHAQCLRCLWLQCLEVEPLAWIPVLETIKAHGNLKDFNMDFLREPREGRRFIYMDFLKLSSGEHPCTAIAKWILGDECNPLRDSLLLERYDLDAVETDWESDM